MISLIQGYNLVRADHPHNIKRGGVAIYHKESMAICFLDVSNLTECLLCEININNKKGYLITNLQITKPESWWISKFSPLNLKIY